MNNEHRGLLKLLEIALGLTGLSRFDIKVDWESLYLLAQEQQVEGLVLDGIDRCHNAIGPNKIS